MKTYELNGRLYRFADDKVPAGAVLHGKAKKPEVEKVEVEPSEPKPKAKKAPQNKARKAGGNK